MTTILQFATTFDREIARNLRGKTLADIRHMRGGDLYDIFANTPALVNEAYEEFFEWLDTATRHDLNAVKVPLLKYVDDGSGEVTPR